MAPEEHCIQLSLWMLNTGYLNSYTFCLCLSYIYMCGSVSSKLLNTDPDPQHCLSDRVGYPNWRKSWATWVAAVRPNVTSWTWRPSCSQLQRTIAVQQLMLKLVSVRAAKAPTTQSPGIRSRHHGASVGRRRRGLESATRSWKPRSVHCILYLNPDP